MNFENRRTKVLKVSRRKTKHQMTIMITRKENLTEIEMLGESLKSADALKYLGSTQFASDGEQGTEINHGMQAGSRKECLVFLCDKRISARVKGKVYKTVYMVETLYGVGA